MKLKVQLDQETLKLLREEIRGVLLDEGRKAALRLAKNAANYLSEFHRAQGREQVAASWTTTDAERIETGWRATTYSDLTGKRLYAASSATGRTIGANNQRWPFAGEWLIRWLDYGTEPHKITAKHGKPDRYGKKWLAFQGNPSQNHSEFTDGAEAIDDFLEPEREQLRFEQEVNHPGFEGDGFLEATRAIILANLKGEVNVMARNVSADLT